jgi:hypothetical protein
MIADLGLSHRRRLEGDADKKCGTHEAGERTHTPPDVEVGEGGNNVFEAREVVAAPVGVGQ